MHPTPSLVSKSSLRSLGGAKLINLREFLSNQSTKDMASHKSVGTKLKDGSKDKFYHFFKFTVYLLPDICPDIVKSIKLIDGTTSWEASTGSHKAIVFHSHLVHGATIEVKDTVKEVTDSSRTIIYKIDEYIMENGGIGDITGVKLEVAPDDLATWTVYYDKTNPDEYLDLLKSVSEAVDNYISTQN
ncbi:hypothetical protein NC652_010555 [Populus alba x Populus x berolinensis]|nr:hypothetical protein NC652_010555 [Populus alba x Populus x berolinensis]